MTSMQPNYTGQNFLRMTVWIDSPFPKTICEMEIDRIPTKPISDILQTTMVDLCPGDCQSKSHLVDIVRVG